MSQLSPDQSSISQAKADTCDVILDNAQKVLDSGKDGLALLPIPGLDIAATTLSSIIGTLKVSYISNCDE